MTSDPVRWLWAAAAVALWLLSIAAVAALRVRARRRTAARAGALSAEAEGEGVLVAFASQTGLAEQLAWRTAEALAGAGAPARVVGLGDLDPTTLRCAGRVLIVASTTGEGDAPDSPSRFVRRHMAAPAELAGLRYAVLALGDRSYAKFCGFGRALDGWLRRSGAEPLFDRVEVDDGDAGALRHWRHQLAAATGAPVAADWTPPAYDRWRLVERAHLNPGGPGGEAWRLAFEPVGHRPDWQAGDIAEVGLPAVEGAPPASREYSVASVAADGRVELIVRRVVRDDGSPGLASGWLTGGLQPGDEVDLRLRSNRSFHGPSSDVPLVLIGAGTGLAGLRGHLRARPAAGHGGAWLLWGERSPVHDAWLDDELQAALAAGRLTRLDRVFSRAPGGRYVQALVEEHADELRCWVDRGATVLVCGSLEGMSAGVHAALEAALGAERVLELLETGRYRRDVY